MSGLFGVVGHFQGISDWWGHRGGHISGVDLCMGRDRVFKAWLERTLLMGVHCMGIMYIAASYV